MRSLLLTFLIFISFSCKRKSNIPVYSNYKAVGKTYLSVLIDSTVVHSNIVDNSLYLEFSTNESTFISKPYNYNLSFPLLQDSLTEILFYYNDFKFIATGNKMSRLKKFFYFPNRDSVILHISKAPFKEGKSEKGGYYTNKQIFAKIQLDSSNILLATLSKDTVTYRR